MVMVTGVRPVLLSNFMSSSNLKKFLLKLCASYFKFVGLWKHKISIDVSSISFKNWETHYLIYNVSLSKQFDCRLCWHGCRETEILRHFWWEYELIKSQWRTTWKISINESTYPLWPRNSISEKLSFLYIWEMNFLSGSSLQQCS